MSLSMFHCGCWERKKQLHLHGSGPRAELLVSCSEHSISLKLSVNYLRGIRKRTCLLDSGKGLTGRTDRPQMRCAGLHAPGVGSIRALASAQRPPLPQLTRILSLYLQSGGPPFPALLGHEHRAVLVAWQPGDFYLKILNPA